MHTSKNKIEVLEDIIKSDTVTASEKPCILSTVLPESVKKDILIYVDGMINIA